VHPRLEFLASSNILTTCYRSWAILVACRWQSSSPTRGETRRSPLAKFVAYGSTTLGSWWLSYCCCFRLLPASPGNFNRLHRRHNSSLRPLSPLPFHCFALFRTGSLHCSALSALLRTLPHRCSPHCFSHWFPGNFPPLPRILSRTGAGCTCSPPRKESP
jgi:hypothetical protein